MSTTTTAPSVGIPAIMTGHTLQSLRDAGYSLPAAIAEVIDNSIEAEANSIDVLLEDVEESGKVHVNRIAIADDGTGMGSGPEGESILQHYLQLGYSTRYLSTTTIGKYGVGAKLAALNFAERIDVWSCSAEAEGWLHAYFDLEEALRGEREGKAIEIAAPDREEVPAELSHLLPEGTGTLVLWSKIDRIKAGRTAANANEVRLDLEKELSRIFRHFIRGGIRLSVNESDLLSHDPLFLMEGTWADAVLAEQPEDQVDGDGSGDRTHATLIADEVVKVGGSSAQLKVTLYPPAVTRKRGLGRDKLAKKLRVPENEGAISFVRLDREINYTNVPRIFPRGVQNPDRFIGIEIKFNPELDNYFGVRHVKRGVEPTGDLRVSIRKLLERYLPEARKQLEDRWGKVSRAGQEHSGEHAEIEEAVKEANRTLPKGRASTNQSPEVQQQALLDLAKDVGKEEQEEQEQYVERSRDLPFVIESVDIPGSQFIDVQHVANQVLIRLNTRHRFYRELWEPIKEIAELDPGAVSGDQAVRTARRTIEALTLLVVAYGKAESMDECPADHFTDLRGYWGQFLDSLLGRVKNVI
jgi:histidine kinase/DNA gyrase B/HSP90-like ATPase